MTRAVSLLVDVLLAIALCVAVFIAVEGGGVYYPGGVRLSLRRIDNVLIAAGALAAIRCLVWGIPSYLVLHVRALFAWLERSGDRGTGRQLSTIVVALAGVTLVAKLWLAWAHPGFFSGDDVEVHEMTLGRLLGYEWSVWNLRLAFFPMVFIYPAQWLAHGAGIADVQTLVFVGRAMVALVSTLSVWLVWRIGLHVFPDRPSPAFLAAGLFAISKLYVSFGSSELPRPVSTVFVLAAFLQLLRPGVWRVWVAGGLIGVAGAFRYSEIMFLAPAVAWLVMERRWRDTLWVTLGAAGAFAIVVGAVDALYTGTPFSSFRHAFDYTITQGLSSRGYNGPFWYLTNAGIWSTWVIVILAVIGTHRRTVAIACWAWLPLLVLSCLPHKEARYLIPAVPFVCLLAVEGIRRLGAYARVLTEGRSDLLRAAVGVCVCLSALHDLAGWRLARTDADMRVIAAVLASDPLSQSGVAVEQEWRVGGRLYLSRRPLVILDSRTMGATDALLRAHPDVDWFVIDAVTVEHFGHAPGFAGRGFRELPRTSGSSYRVFARR